MPGDKTIMPNGVSADGTTFVRYQGGAGATEFSVPDGVVKIGRAFADRIKSMVGEERWARWENGNFSNAADVSCAQLRNAFAPTDFTPGGNSTAVREEQPAKDQSPIHLRPLGSATDFNDGQS